MGEAKRRKALDPNYGKIRNRPNKKEDLLDSVTAVLATLASARIKRIGIDLFYSVDVAFLETLGADCSFLRNRDFVKLADAIVHGTGADEDELLQMFLAMDLASVSPADIYIPVINSVS